MNAPRRAELEAFRASWRHLVSRWDETRATDPAEAKALLVRMLAEPDLFASGTADTPVEPQVEVACSVALIRAAGTFDAAGYREANSDNANVASGAIAPVVHFCRMGWRWLRAPEAGFDVWWYWNTYLDPTSTEINPYVHYLLVGRHVGHGRGPGVPAPRPLPPNHPTAGPRRICLFAAYDADGIVDDYVVNYLTELSRFADVYYLADGEMAAAELAKLDGITHGAWAERHGGYDFGSFSLLITKYLGWELIDEYDELLLANDSCFLLRPLDEVFETMNRREADWWGLQGTKRDISAKHGRPDPVPLPEAKSLHTDAEDWNPYYHLHISSYFLAFRSRVIRDAGFRERLETVVPQSHKGLVILKYEIGVSRYLITAGFDFDTFVDAVYPFHPLYSSDYFDLMAAGFPFLKRNFLTDNTMRAPDLAGWQERVLAANPGAPVELFERNMARVSPADVRAASLRVVTRPDGTVDLGEPMSGPAIRVEDLRTPKFDHWWSFPVCAFDHTFAGNERAIFEEVRFDPSIKKIILTRSREVDIDGENVVIVPLNSPEGQYFLLRSSFIFVKHGPRLNVPMPLNPQLHHFINTWHGIPLKRFGLATEGLSDNDRKAIMRTNMASWAVLTSSKMDTLAMSAAFFPASYGDMWPTGLPRNDFILRDEERLPEDLRAAADRLRAEAAGRRLVLFLPTFKDGQADAYYRFSDVEVERLRAWCEVNNAVIGVREHMADKARTYSRLLAPLDPIDVSSKRYPDLEVLYRVADVLISDYSSCLADFMITGKPLISFAYDYDHYAGTERGLFYELERVLPGPVCRTFDELEDALGTVFDERSQDDRDEYAWRRHIFHDHVDDQASWRVVQRVKALYLSDPTPGT